MNLNEYMPYVVFVLELVEIFARKLVIILQYLVCVIISTAFESIIMRGD